MKMKTTLAMLLVLLLLPVSAAKAEGTVYYAEEDEALVESLEAAKTTACPDRLEAMNQMLDAQAEDCALITQQQIIEGLQGYSSYDMSKDIQLVRIIAQNDLYLVCSSAVAEETGVTGLEELKNYLEKNEYALFIMRSFEASNADYASMRLMEELTFDSEIFVDEEDQLENLDQGSYVLVTDTTGAVKLKEEGFAVLGALTGERTEEFPDLACAGECGLPVIRGTYYALAASAKAGKDGFKLPQGEPDESLMHELTLHAADEEIKLEEDITSYVDYMTAEGLFFY